MRHHRRHPFAAGLVYGVLLGALLSRMLDVGAALILGAWVGACIHRATMGRRRPARPAPSPVQGTAAPPRAEQPDPRRDRQRREEELHGVKLAQERAKLRDQLIRLRRNRTSWASSRKQQQAREEAAYRRGVEETLAAWPRQDDWS